MSRKPALVILLLLGMLAVVAALVKEPHNFSQSQCNDCHAAGTSGTVVRHQLAAPLTVLCGRCHEKVLSEGYLHPVNVRPRRVTVPKDMPLSRSGEITCATCHDVHASFMTPYGTPTHYLRRLERGKKFCDICHNEPAGRSHQGALAEAHFQSKYVATSATQEIDAMSKNCISCHDGAYSSSTVIRAGVWTHQRSLMRHDNGAHPIGAGYEAARTRKGSKTDLKPLPMVDRRIRFFDGKIGCGSCHDPYSAIEKRLVISDRGSALCFSCHAMN